MELLGSHRKLFKWLGILLVGIPGIAGLWAELLLNEPLIPYLIKKMGGLDMSNNIWLIALPFALMALGVLLLFLIWREEKITKEKVNPQIAQMENKDKSKEKRQLKLDLVKLFHDGKDCHSKLKRAQNNKNINEQVTAELYFESWFSDVTNALKNTNYEEIWYENKVVDYQRDQISEYLSASDRALERLESIIKLISHTEGSAIPDMLKSPHPPELQISYQKHEFSIDNGVPIITVWAEYRPTGTMLIEAVELRLVGERKPSLDWEVYEVKQDAWISSDNKFRLPDGISPGEHDVRLAAFANGQWWGCPQSFTIIVPEIKS